MSELNELNLQTQIIELSLRVTQMQVFFMEQQNALADSLNQFADDVEKKMAFIIDQQASFSVNIDKLQEAQRHTDRRLESLTSKLETLIDAQNQTTKDVSALTKDVGVLAKSQARTDAKLDTFMDTVERFIQESREQRNGKK